VGTVELSWTSSTPKELTTLSLVGLPAPDIPVSRMLAEAPWIPSETIVALEAISTRRSAGEINVDVLNGCGDDDDVLLMASCADNAVFFPAAASASRTSMDSCCNNIGNERTGWLRLLGGIHTPGLRLICTAPVSASSEVTCAGTHLP